MKRYSTIILRDITESEPPLLEYGGVIAVPAINRRFHARNYFYQKVCEEDRVWIHHVGVDFTENFLRKIEEPTDEREIYCYISRRPSNPHSILAMLGGEEKAKANLSAIYFLMKQQGRGEDGHLLSDNRENIFFVPNAPGVVETIRLNWHKHGWEIESNRMSDYPYLYKNTKVFSGIRLAV